MEWAAFVVCVLLGMIVGLLYDVSEKLRQANVLLASIDRTRDHQYPVQHILSPGEVDEITLWPED